MLYYGIQKTYIIVIIYQSVVVSYHSLMKIEKEVASIYLQEL